ncbi:CRISPR-associated endonuclease Cas2 [Hydrogenophaga sp. NH-16]|uniref:CRISPR-associated endonuclease Cas2 n=1 Tax=Hydrogenophaga sp. NH-16 TaxID=2184519 RepID=UPI000FD75FFE|nr:CRISPR-associated endonuclease Cas2 [Hydrogenophaga sp. NH-16]
MPADSSTPTRPPHPGRYWISYDVADNHRRFLLHQALTGWGTRIQFSVFECSLLPRELRTMQRQIDCIIDPEQDHVVVLQCAKPGWPRHHLLAQPHDLSRDYWLA